ncbi:MAG: sulfatase-like hydrolase/transferase [Bacteroidetes bacterium]|nr:sulfatase-like hydrolase/transferase [Bacteroidota bacterium]
MIFIGGIRFDLSGIFMLNAVYILLQLIPLNIRFKNWYQKTVLMLFYITNSLALFTNFADSIYFRFTAKRLTGDIFNFLSVGGDFGKLLPQFIVDYWYIALLLIIFVVIFIKVISNIKLKETKIGSFKIFFKQLTLFVISLFITIVGIRGGFQLKPIDIINASNYAENKNLPLVLNSPFTIFKTIGLPVLNNKVYISDSSKLNDIYIPLQLPHENKASFRKLNVVIIILESFSQEHIGALNHIKGYTGFTPFLDSLMHKGAYIKGFANGKRSIEGIPAILAGIPTLMNESYITSLYAGNKINSLASLLKTKGYNTSFYHGGSNGTMGFESFTKIAGFGTYYGRSQYNNETDYDGKWGIWDEPFLQNYAKQLNLTTQPFLSAVFTLSSHHPYKVPDKYKGKFRKGKLDIQESIMYADYSLQKFFETASKMPWYDSTLFVITADHTSEADLEYYKNNIGMYAIPILFYLPNGSLNINHQQIGQQIDIMPSILDFLNFDKPYFAFGTSVFDTSKPHFNISYLNEEYQLIKDNYALKFDGEKFVSLYQISQDSLLQHNLINTEVKEKKEMEVFLKALIQQYNNSLINNKMLFEGRN